MLSVLQVHIPSDIPIVGCELTPYVLLRRPDKTVSTDDVPESAPLDGHFLRYKWYRIQRDKKVVVCSVHPSEQTTLQCLGCVKGKIVVAKSYHCSPKCFSDAWQHHRILHDRAASAAKKMEMKRKRDLNALKHIHQLPMILTTFSSSSVLSLVLKQNYLWDIPMPLQHLVFSSRRSCYDGTIRFRWPPFILWNFYFSLIQKPMYRYTGALKVDNSVEVHVHWFRLYRYNFINVSIQFDQRIDTF